jgi:hypothetical protein
MSLRLLRFTIFDLFHLEDTSVTSSSGMFDSFCIFNIRTVPLNAWTNRSGIEVSTVMVQSMLIVVEGKVEGY